MQKTAKLLSGVRMAIVSACLLFAAQTASAAQSKPNVIFILADDLGYGDLGITWQNARAEKGNPSIKTPNIDRIAVTGVTLSNHYCASPVCAPSRASILTGRRQGECSLRDNCFDQPFTETETLGTVMKDAGYATWAVGKWGLAGGGESNQPVSSHPLDKGFDYFYGFLDHMAGHTYYHYEGSIKGAYMGITENRTRVTSTATNIYSTDLFAAKTKQLITERLANNPDQPFFLYLAVNTIHGSGGSYGVSNGKNLHVPGRAYPEDGVDWDYLQANRETSPNTWLDPLYADDANLTEPAKRYATAVTRLDNAIGDIVKLLETKGIAEDTMIIFTSDNGPADEYGADPSFFESAGPFDGLKRDVYEGGMRVPALISWPGKIEAGTVDDTPSQGYAWLNFIKAASEGRYEPMKSEVLTQYENNNAGEGTTYAQFLARKVNVRGLQQMVRDGDYVALRVKMRSGLATRLYNVKDDPFQETDLAGDSTQQARLAKMTAMLDDINLGKYGSYIYGSAFPALKGMALSDITPNRQIKVKMGGSYVDNGDATLFCRNEERDSGGNLTKITYLAQKKDDGYVRCIPIEFTESYGNVWAKAGTPRYNTKDHDEDFGTDFSGEGTQSLATNEAMKGYGLYELGMADREDVMVNTDFTRTTETTTLPDGWTADGSRIVPDARFTLGTNGAVVKNGWKHDVIYKEVSIDHGLPTTIHVETYGNREEGRLNSVLTLSSPTYSVCIGNSYYARREIAIGTLDEEAATKFCTFDSGSADSGDLVPQNTTIVAAVGELDVGGPMTYDLTVNGTSLTGIVTDTNNAATAISFTLPATYCFTKIGFSFDAPVGTVGVKKIIVERVLPDYTVDGEAVDTDAETLDLYLLTGKADDGEVEAPQIDSIAVTDTGVCVGVSLPTPLNGTKGNLSVLVKDSPTDEWRRCGVIRPGAESSAEVEVGFADIAADPAPSAFFRVRAETNPTSAL